MKELLAFLEEVEQFKHIQRAVHNPRKLETLENDAEHSWHLAMMVLVLHDKFPELNLAKCLSFAIIHDLPELYAGDTVIFSKEEKNKHEREEKAIKKILSQLPEPTKTRFKKLFSEYENKSSREARLVYELDKIQPMMLITMGRGVSWKKYKIPKDKLLERKFATVSDEFGLREILVHYHEIATKNNYYYDG